MASTLAWTVLILFPQINQWVGVSSFPMNTACGTCFASFHVIPHFFICSFSVCLYVPFGNQPSMILEGSVQNLFFDILAECSQFTSFFCLWIWVYTCTSFRINLLLYLFFHCRPFQHCPLVHETYLKVCTSLSNLHRCSLLCN